MNFLAGNDLNENVKHMRCVYIQAIGHG